MAAVAVVGLAGTVAAVVVSSGGPSIAAVTAQASSACRFNWPTGLGVTVPKGVSLDARFPWGPGLIRLDGRDSAAFLVGGWGPVRRTGLKLRGFLLCALNLDGSKVEWAQGSSAEDLASVFPVTAAALDVGRPVFVASEVGPPHTNVELVAYALSLGPADAKVVATASRAVHFAWVAHVSKRRALLFATVPWRGKSLAPGNVTLTALSSAGARLSSVVLTSQMFTRAAK